MRTLLRLGQTAATLVVAAALLLLVPRLLQAAQACSVPGIDEGELAVSPRAFDAQAPVVASKQLACGDPRAVPPASRAPFWLGVATAAHQVEGAAAKDGKGPSIWDTFEQQPGKIAGGATAAVADDFYNKLEEDVALMRYLGVRNFRFSFSWPRLLPTGRGAPNPAGVGFYKRLLRTLKANCIEPYATLYHWDLPQALYDEYSGFISPKIQDDFVAYAETVWRLFGPDVQYWTTFNEPETFCESGYGSGEHAPGRCSNRTRCAAGNSTIEPWMCASNVLNAHARAAQSFKKLVPNGKLSINLSMMFVEPQTGNQSDKDAAARLLAFGAGRYLDVLYTGDWSPEVKQGVPPDALPAFTQDQSAALKATKPDWVALNHYTSRYGVSYENGTGINAYTTNVSADGVPLPAADSSWLLIYPAGLRGILAWVKNRYANPAIIITESGMSVPEESSLPLDKALCDRARVDYYRSYLLRAVEAVRQDGVNLQGYFAWTLLDNFEWADGYSRRFGVVYVDFASLRRYLKASSLWLANYFGLSTATAPP